MLVLVACEFSGVVRDAFIRRGHRAVSCDLLPSDAGEPHLQCDVGNVLHRRWDLMIAFPPCTHLASSGARWFKDKQKEQEEAVAFVRWLMNAPIPRIAIENPIGVLSSRIRPPDQIIQPWQFGHGEVKATCLWLKGLPKLTPTVSEHPDLFVPLGPKEREQRVWKMPPSKDRWKLRSKTYPGIAQAMADQWG